jgi:hypothetical protein
MASDLEDLYPWDEWLDGQWREFSAGADFHCDVTRANRTAAYFAFKRGGRWEAEVTSATTLRGRFVPGDS